MKVLRERIVKTGDRYVCEAFVKRFLRKPMWERLGYTEYIAGEPVRFSVDFESKEAAMNWLLPTHYEEPHTPGKIVYTREVSR